MWYFIWIVGMVVVLAGGVHGTLWLEGRRTFELEDSVE